MSVTPAEAKTIAASAYVFVAPLVTSYAAMYREAIDPSSPLYSGGFGHWLHHRTATTRESGLAAAHSTSLHSSAWLDLRSEPWVFSMSSMEAGWAYVVRTTDLWGFVVDEAPDGDDHGRVLLASPAWVGEVPADVDRVVRGESDFVRSEIWIRMPEAGDLVQVRSIQDEFQLAPQSALAGVAPPDAAPPIEWWPVQGDAMTSYELWSVANFALTLLTPHEQDRAMLERVAEIGVAAGRRWDPALFDDQVREAIGEGIDDAITELMRASATVDDSGELHRSRADTDRDYFGRALGALRHGPRRMSSAG